MIKGERESDIVSFVVNEQDLTFVRVSFPSWALFNDVTIAQLPLVNDGAAKRSAET